MIGTAYCVVVPPNASAIVALQSEGDPSQYRGHCVLLHCAGCSDTTRGLSRAELSWAAGEYNIQVSCACHALQVQRKELKFPLPDGFQDSCERTGKFLTCMHWAWQVP